MSRFFHERFLQMPFDDEPELRIQGMALAVDIQDEERVDGSQAVTGSWCERRLLRLSPMRVRAILAGLFFLKKFLRRIRLPLFLILSTVTNIHHLV